MTHYSATEESPPACGRYDPIDDMRTNHRGNVTCPACIALDGDTGFEQPDPSLLRELP